MNKFAIAVHGGAGPDSEFIRQHRKDYDESLRQALDAGYRVLEEGGSALNAVEASVNYLEDNPLFNAGRGSALNKKAEIEMDASIMDGRDRKSGAVCIVKNVKNPVTLARAVMEKTEHVYIGGIGALELATKTGLTVMPDAYFMTDHAFEQYREAMEEAANTMEEAGAYQVKRRTHGTVGAVALDKNGNIAAATSTGGIENKSMGRIGDTSMIGTGTYANNKTCAVSSTGDGEVLIQNVMAFHVSALMQYKGLGLKEACHYLLHEDLKEAKGDMGIIALDAEGNIALEFNSERMHRGYRTSDGKQFVATYP